MLAFAKLKTTYRKIDKIYSKDKSSQEEVTVL